MANKFKNTAQSALVKTGFGRLYGLFCSASSSLVAELVDGIYDNDDVADKATGVLTITGAIADGQTATIGAITYRFKETTAQAYDVKIGLTDAITLDNWKAAINASGAGDGSDYHAGTLAHPTVAATTNTDTAQTVEALTAGAAGNAIVTTETMANGSWGGATLTGGIDAQEIIIEEFTLTAGQTYNFSPSGDGIAFNTGLYFRIKSGTGEVTIEYH